MNNTSLGGHINGFNDKVLYNLGFQNVAVGIINGVATLTGFSCTKMAFDWDFH